MISTQSQNTEVSPAGLLIVNKPTGVTSRAVVNQVARLLPRSKVGHSGTLDPLATGILVVCVGAATRLAEFVQAMPKSYQTTIRLGARSDTLDADGRIEQVECPCEPSIDLIGAAIAPLVGTITQQPPQYSALKINGQRAYDLARAGEVPALAPRQVRVDRIELVRFAWPILELEIDCGAGTYIRSIARDLGDALGCGGYVETLTRHRTGNFTLDDAIDPETLSAATIAGFFRPAIEAVANLPHLTIDMAEVEAVRQGKRLQVAAARVDRTCESGPIALVDSTGTLIAVGEIDLENGSIQPRKVLL